MKLIVAGGTGLVGQLLIPELLQDKHDIYVIGRNEEKIKQLFANHVHAIKWNNLTHLNPDDFDAIINLAGENITQKRWSAKVKKCLFSSRIDTTRQLVLWGANAKEKKPHLYNASAVGIYGLQKSLSKEKNIFLETTPPINSSRASYSTLLVTQWEDAAIKGVAIGMPVTLMRFGVVLKRGEGMLKKLEFPAQYGLGAVLGSGEQPLAWIDSTDLVQAILFLLSHPEITGPVNLVAPECISQKIFTNTLAQVLKKPAFLWLPAWTVRILFGQMGEELLLSGQNVIPQRLTDNHFIFKYPILQTALCKEFEK